MDGRETRHRTQQTVFRAESPGTITIIAEEVLIGVAFCIPPLPEMSTVECTFTITDE